jgi:hypothetical protein
MNSIVAYLVILIAATTVVAYADVVVNEMEVSPPTDGTDWVELYNSGNQTIDISSWTVTIKDKGWVGNMNVPKGTTLSPLSFYVLEGSQKWHHNGGGFATLQTESGEKMDETAYRMDNMSNDFTWARHPDGYDTNTDGDWCLGYATKGRSNVIGTSR